VCRVERVMLGGKGQCGGQGEVKLVWGAVQEHASAVAGARRWPGNHALCSQIILTLLSAVSSPSP